jgi:hypothetical protein
MKVNVVIQPVTAETARQWGEQVAQALRRARQREAECKAQGWEDVRKEVDPVTGDVTYYFGDFISTPRAQPCDECTDCARCSRIGQCLRYRCAFGEVDKP